MEMSICLDFRDIKEIIARHFCVDPENIYVKNERMSDRNCTESTDVSSINCYDMIVQEYEEICKEICRRAVGGVKISDVLLKRRDELETHLCCDHIPGEPCWREAYKLPRETDEITAFAEERKRYDL